MKDKGREGSKYIRVEIEVYDSSYTSREIIDIVSRALGESMVKDFKISSSSEIDLKDRSGLLYS